MTYPRALVPISRASGQQLFYLPALMTHVFLTPLLGPHSRSRLLSRLGLVWDHRLP